MLRTRAISDQELSRWLRWLDSESTFRASALVAFGNEINSLHQYQGLPGSTYYVVEDNRMGRLLLRTTLLESQITGPTLAMSFARIFNKPENSRAEAHFWLKNTLEEAICNDCGENNIDYISAKAQTEKGEHVFSLLKELWERGEVEVSDIKIHPPNPPYGTFVVIYP